MDYETIETFMEIGHTKHNFFVYHKQINKTNKDIWRVVLPARHEGIPACHGSFLDRSKNLPYHTGTTRRVSRA